MSRKRVEITIRGLVQGVGFRFYALRKAQELGIVGTVRNTEEDVEVTAEGDETVLRMFIEELRIGPPSAQVTGMDVKWMQPNNLCRSFSIIH